MSNELILILTLIIEFSMLELMYFFFKKEGVFAWSVLATIAYNIEVLILVHAFGADMTLGNILFASTFLATDILSENYDKKTADKAVLISIVTSILFLAISQSWFLYHPASQDTTSPAIRAVFSQTPRLILASVAVYVVVQFMDVALYHRIWHFTEEKSGSRKKFLWLRNNAATMLSQLVNSFLYNWLAFYKIYPTKTLISISLSSFVIFIVTSLADTPFIYLSRKIHLYHTKKELVGKHTL